MAANGEGTADSNLLVAVLTMPAVISWTDDDSFTTRQWESHRSHNLFGSRTHHVGQTRKLTPDVHRIGIKFK